MYIVQIPSIYGVNCKIIFPIYYTFQTCNMFYTTLIGYSIYWIINMKLGTGNPKHNPRNYEKQFMVGTILSGLVVGLIPVLTNNIGPIYTDDETK